MPTLGDAASLSALNEALSAWIDRTYHQRPHSSTSQTPLARYLAHLHALRAAPADLRQYFRIPVRRKVDKVRTVSLRGRLYEAPVGTVGCWVTLLYHDHDLDRVEVLVGEESRGFLTPLNPGINARVRRTANLDIELTPKEPGVATKPYRGGSLFEERSS
jgi:hypothetical protein